MFGQTSAFGEAKVKETDDKGSSAEPSAETNVFARLGTKRKEDTPALIEKPVAEEDVPAEADVPRQPPKRPLVRSRGPPAELFGKALSGLRKEGTGPSKREAKKLEWDDRDAGGGNQERQRSATPPVVKTVTREITEKTEETDPVPSTSAPQLQTTPTARRAAAARKESTESLSGQSPTDCTVLQCRKLPPALNRKDILEKHFSRFGKVRRIYCRPARNSATVTFDDHASAAKAKKKGRMLHKHELLLLWQRKKLSPGDKGGREQGADEEPPEAPQLQVSSPLKRPQLRPAALSSNTFGSPVKKSSMPRSFQFDADSQRDNSSDPQSSERPVPSSLLHLVGQMAETAEDKYRLLEQRDKILRQGRPKRTDLNLSKVFVGTCPDMCPEKERYMRETRKQLSVYEVLPDTEMVDHTAAIKEYSRSSADQEEPLPHELRPLPVLSRTMDYLVTQIMDQGLDNYRDWYDFVWNRTRGIRKDITQQHLCCPDTVALIEKCTRFHVHCAHQLCEEHMSSFDAKINNENMTKCLQSLKEMYQDLDTRSVYCPREAEFRQYNVLLKLDDSDILREVQQFRDEVRNSPEVKFAVQAFTAVNSNNFVRFFKLVKAASYLSSCLLHRYFNQVRAKALKTLNMAHTVGPRSTAFPLEDVIRMLMFRSSDEATDFIQQYGLSVSDGVVELSRTGFQEPELPVSQKRSEVILEKRRVLIGEVVNGGPLPNPPQHTPVCSFDSQSKYRGEAPQTDASPPIKAATVKPEPGPLAEPESLSSRAQDKPSLFGMGQAAPSQTVSEETGETSQLYPEPPESQPLFQPLPPPYPQPQPVKAPSPPPKPVYRDEDIEAELNTVIEEVLEAAVKEVADVAASFTSAALAESSVQLEAMVGEVTGDLLKEISSTEIQLEQERVAEEKRKMEEARRKQEHEAFLMQYSFSLCTELVYQVLEEAIKDTAASEIQEAVNEKAARVAKCTEEVCTGLVEDTLNADIALLVEEILNVELQRIQKYIKRWRDVVAVRRQLKRQMRAFPAAPCFVDPRFKLRALAPSAPEQPSIEQLARGLVNLGHAGTLAVSSSRLLKMREEVIHKMRVQYFYQLLLEESSWSPLDLPTLVTENIPDPPEKIFWKALLLLPSDHETGASVADRILSDWLEGKLSGESESVGYERPPDGTLHTLCVSNSVYDTGEQTHSVHIGVKMSRGPLSEDSLSKMEECYELQGTGAVVLLLPALPLLEPRQSEQDVPLLSALLQLRQLQQVSTWHCPLPLVVLVPGQDRGTCHTERLAEALMLSTLVEDGLISEYTFFFIPETTCDLLGSRQLTQALRWLLSRAPPHFPLSCQTLVQLVEAGLSRDFGSRLYSHRQERATARLSSQHPSPIIHLYNAVLAHIADKVTSQGLSKLSWPPAEFSLPETRELVPHLGWNSAEHLAWLREVVLSLQLPQWDCLSPTGTWSELYSSIFDYAAQIPMSRRSQPLLMSRLENLLEMVRLRAHCRRTPGSKVRWSSWVDGEDDECPAFERIPWDDVLVICIDHKLKEWQVPGPPVCEDAVTEDGEILVYFLTEASGTFRAPDEWTEALAQTHREKHEEKEGACARRSPSDLFFQQSWFFSPKEPEQVPESTLDISYTPAAEETLAHRVLQSVEHEKAESQRMMEQFQRWADGEPLEQLYSRLFVPSSTLLSIPPTLVHPSSNNSRDAAAAPSLEPDERLPNAPRASLSWRMQELERQIKASREEEQACGLHLSGLLNIVDD